MRIIKKLAEQINEEVDGAIDYAMEALDCKLTDPELSKFYFELAKTEYGHMEKLHDHVLRKIKEAREKNPDPPARPRPDTPQRRATRSASRSRQSRGNAAAAATRCSRWASTRPRR